MSPALVFPTVWNFASWRWFSGRDGDDPRARPRRSDARADSALRPQSTHTEEHRALAIARDAALVARMRAGDEQALAELVRVYARALSAEAAVWLETRDLVDDVLQDVFLALWERRDALHTHESLAGYLHRVTRNRAVDLLRNDLATRRLADIIRTDPAPETVDIPGSERTLEAADVDSWLDGALRQLPPSPRQIFLLNYQGGLSYAEIAERLGITQETVRKQIYRATQRLAEYFARHPFG
jgi:RNA polymerase sigma factor (sigma-70 family)